MTRTLVVVSAVLSSIFASTANAQCTTQPVPESPTEVVVPCSGEGCESCRVGRFPACQFDVCGRVLIAWEDIPLGTPGDPVQDNIKFLRFDADCTTQPYGDDSCGTALSAGGDCPDTEKGPETKNERVSLAAGNPSNAPVYAGWTASYSFASTPNQGFFLANAWNLASTPTPAAATSGDCDGSSDATIHKSVGVGDVIIEEVFAGVANPGLSLSLLGSPLRTCNTACFRDRWRPCVATRSSDGKTAVVWAEPVVANDADSAMDIYLAQFDASGNPLGPSGVKGIQVNSTDADPTRSQESPAVALDDLGNLIIVWRSTGTDTCANPSLLQVYARRFLWGGDFSPPSDPVPLGAEFQVNSDPTRVIPIDANPTVALTMNSNDPGRFVVAFNAVDQNGTPTNPADDTVEVHAQKFNALGQREGGQFRATVTTQSAQLAHSGQHTVAYGPVGQIALAYTIGNGAEPDGGVRFTLLPPGYGETTPFDCIKGDVNGDGRVDGEDIQAFVKYYIMLGSGRLCTLGSPPADCDRLECAMDLGEKVVSGSVVRYIDEADRMRFVRLLLGQKIVERDCNGSCVADDVELADGSESDCNSNGIPDSCELSPRNQMFSVAKDSAMLRRIEPQTGEIVRSILITHSDGRTVKGADGLVRDLNLPSGEPLLFALLRSEPFGGGAQIQQLVKIDPLTGIATPVGTTSEMFRSLAMILTTYGVGTDILTILPGSPGSPTEKLYQLAQTDATATYICDLTDIDSGGALGYRVFSNGELYYAGGLATPIFDGWAIGFPSGTPTCCSFSSIGSSGGLANAGALTEWVAGESLYAAGGGILYTLRLNGSATSVGMMDHVSTGLAFIDVNNNRNSNGIPDDCEALYTVVTTAPAGDGEPLADCNGNLTDDAYDISSEYSADCNSNGTPDECEIAIFDCNSNGVPDDCDIDPEDPDGDEVVSDDCNANGLPDECDLIAEYFPSYDCNTNGIPDECDIAEVTSEDCNTNGVPDECDIAAETSEDADTNGIPDECEEESMMGGGGEGDGPPSSSYDNPAWETFWQWQADNAASLAAMSPWDRFKATVDKLRELGLPAAIPWARVQSP